MEIIVIGLVIWTVGLSIITLSTLSFLGTLKESFSLLCRAERDLSKRVDLLWQSLEKCIEVDRELFEIMGDWAEQHDQKST